MKVTNDLVASDSRLTSVLLDSVVFDTVDHTFYYSC